MTDVVGVDVEAIVALREEYRRQMNCQIVHDSWHQRGFTNSYLLRVDRETAGYGSIGGGPRRDLSALCQMRDCRPVKVPR